MAGRVTARLGRASSRLSGHLGAESNAFPHVEDVTGFGEPVDQGGGQMRVLEEGGPFAKTQVGGDQGRALLVALLQQGEEQTDLGWFGLGISDLINQD